MIVRCFKCCKKQFDEKDCILQRGPYPYEDRYFFICPNCQKEESKEVLR